MGIKNDIMSAKVPGLISSAKCCILCDPIPRRSGPFFRTRELMHDLIESFTQEANP